MTNENNENTEEITGRDDEQTNEHSAVEKLLKEFSFAPDETVAVEIDVPSAMWTRMEMHIEENYPDLTPEEWIVEAIRHRFSILDRPAELGRPVVELDEEEWQLIELNAYSAIQMGEDPEKACWDAVFEHILATPEIVVDGAPIEVEGLISDTIQDDE